MIQWLTRQRTQVERAFKEHTRLAPSFIIIGAQRAGTTSLYNYLAGHPDLIPARRTEIHFFDRNYHRGAAWYRHQFRAARASVFNRRLITGESTPYYLFHPLVPERVRQTFPDIKLIVLLRNPVDRAFSHYHYSVKLGVETLTFEEAVAREPERLAGERERLCREPRYHSESHIHYSYLARSLYGDQLTRWMDLFPREQFLILRCEDMDADPPAVLRPAFDFLGLPAHPLDHYRRYNASSYTPMNPATRASLLDYFAPHNERLYRLLDRDFDWDR
jgi:hypothetical protein